MSLHEIVYFVLIGLWLFGIMICVLGYWALFDWDPDKLLQPKCYTTFCYKKNVTS